MRVIIFALGMLYLKSAGFQFPESPTWFILMSCWAAGWDVVEGLKP